MNTEHKPRHELSVGDSTSLITLLAVLLSLVITESLPLWFRVLLLAPIVLVICWLATKSPWTDSWSRARQGALVLALLVIFGCLAAAQWSNEHPKIAFQYGGKALDSQTVILSESCPKVQIQLQTNMCTDPNYPNYFNIQAIKMVSDKPVQLHEARLGFSSAVTMLVNAGWQQLNQEGTAYGYEYELTIPVILPAGQSVDVPQFAGTPLPTPETQVTLTVTYGDSMTSKAKFTLRAPEASTN